MQLANSWHLDRARRNFVVNFVANFVGSCPRHPPAARPAPCVAATVDAATPPPYREDRRRDCSRGDSPMHDQRTAQLPPVTAAGLPIAERKSLALHAAVGAKLPEDSELLQRAKDRVATWQRDEQVHPWYAAAWAEVLGRSPSEIRDFLTDPSEFACSLRQVSPFAGALTVAERLAVLRRFAPGQADEPQPT